MHSCITLTTASIWIHLDEDREEGAILPEDDLGRGVELVEPRRTEVLAGEDLPELGALAEEEDPGVPQEEEAERPRPPRGEADRLEVVKRHGEADGDDDAREARLVPVLVHHEPGL